MIVNGIQDKRFLGPVTNYSIDIVDHAFKQPEVSSAAANMIVDVLINEKRVLNEAINFC